MENNDRDDVTVRDEAVARRRFLRSAVLLGAGIVASSSAAAAQAAPLLTEGAPDPYTGGAAKESSRMSSEQPQQNVGYSDTPVLPGGKWRVHDGSRPQPTVVTPGTESSPAAAGKAPSDAVVLFDGTDLSRWKGRGDAAADWKVENGYMEVVGGKGDITSRDEFGDGQYHVEFMTPAEVKGNGQGRGNSGVFIMGRYEMQVLDCYENPTYPDGTVGSVYGQYPPLVNAARKPGEWQTYDILWTAPRFKADGSVEKPAHVTVILNGVVVQNHTELMGGTTHRALPEYRQHGPTGPIRLQDHGNPVRFRNIWVRPIKGHDQA